MAALQAVQALASFTPRRDPDPTPDGGDECPAHLEDDLAEIESIILNIRDQSDERYARLEALVGNLATAVAANQRRLTQIEEAFASLASFSKLWAAEADRLSSE